ncbi:peptidylprolyl isomerase [Sphingomonas canadensis]|uniref:peptidylprolyl isomerase n=1 Tax=Sphingomonas canadensis TaxID=1219257 RepID=A0ABW3H3E4_9SPHN|nr:peptidylprolyl isomerase [Sphingomonas canadensis]MCW3835552.1 peptidylprolyl isomerase [Sphingomonas canadensis]
MIRYLLAMLMALACAIPAAAQPPAPSPPPAPVRVAIETDAGTIVAEIFVAQAPVSAGNFLRYVDSGRLNGMSFYRAVQVEHRWGFVQFGVRANPKKVFPPIRHEPTSETGLSHLNGTLSTARLAPGTAQGDFTIMVGDQLYMDADPARAEEKEGYAAFGRVVEGMEVVHAILDGPKSPTGYFKNEELITPVKIIRARRLP